MAESESGDAPPSGPSTGSPADARPDLRGVGFMIGSAFAFSLMSLQVKLLDRIPVSEKVLVRALVTLAITGVALGRRRIRPWGIRPRRLILRGLLGFAGLCCFFAAIGELELTDATVLHYLNPILTALFAAIWLGEGLAKRHVIALATGFAGVVLVVRPASWFGVGEALSPTGVLFGLLGAAFAAGAYTTIRGLREEEPLVVVFYFPLVTVPLILPWVAVDFVAPTWTEAWLLLGVGVTTQVAQVFLTKGLQLWPAGPAMSLAYTQILFAAIWQAIFFGVMPNALGLLGGLLIFLGTLVVSIGGRRRRSAG